MAKLTRKQNEARNAILAWLDGGKHLEHKYVLNNYVPQDITEGGKYYTPIPIADELIKRVQPYLLPIVRVLEPCAGIGHLIYSMPATWDVDAYELDQEASRIGCKLFQHVHWFIELSPFTDWDLIEGEYDLAIMNPPFNANLGMNEAHKRSDARWHFKSEYKFLELAVHALDEGGILAVIGTQLFLNNSPKPLAEALWTQLEILEDPTHLDGNFTFAGIDVYSYLFRKVNSPLVIEKTRQAFYNIPKGPERPAPLHQAYEDPMEILNLLEADTEELSKAIAELKAMLKGE